ncbi:MAG TPA: response regulator [Polyangiaceae bacterium]|nr:response regulator [Polyangiaceae bacterium]
MQPKRVVNVRDYGSLRIGDCRSPRILLAEDDAHMRRLLARALRRSGFEVVQARNGSELLDKIVALVLRPPDGESVDLVITDVRMPIATGLDALAVLRQSDWFTPVIVLTAFGDPATHDEAYMLGSSVVFDKPFDINALCAHALTLVGYDYPGPCATESDTEN